MVGIRKPKPPINNIYKPIMGTTPNNWVPQWILYRKYNIRFESAHPGYVILVPDFTYIYKASDYSIASFCSEMLAGRIPLKDRLDPNYKPTYETPFDITTINNSIVVIELDKSIKWQFPPSGMGLTSKEDYPGKDGQLYHVDKAGAIIPAGSPNGDECRMLFFQLIERDYTGMQQPHNGAQFYNLHVQLLQPGTFDPVDIVIDPTIPNDGGHLPLEFVFE